MSNAEFVPGGGAKCFVDGVDDELDLLILREKEGRHPDSRADPIVDQYLPREQKLRDFVTVRDVDRDRARALVGISRREHTESPLVGKLDETRGLSHALHTYRIGARTAKDLRSLCRRIQRGNYWCSVQPPKRAWRVLHSAFE